MLITFILAKRAALATSLAFPALASAQTLQVTLAPSNYNGYNVSCFGAKDGSITVSVTGGTPPYEFTWSTGDTGSTISEQPAGYYRVSVQDSNSEGVEGEITLTEPQSMKVAVSPHVFGNGYNMSCYECSNGSIQLAVSHGVPPYSFLWEDGPTNQNRWALDQGTYKVTVSDANGCESLQADAYISRPERSDWTMGGNAGTDPATDFVGTTDAHDLVFKTNGAERLRVKSDGGLQATSLAFDQGYRLVMVDSTGQMKLLTDGTFNDAPLATTCYDHGSNLPWTFCGNIVFPTAKLGTRNYVPLRLISNDEERMVLYTNGKVGIGTGTADDQLTINTALEKGGLTVNNTRTDANAHAEIRFKKNGAQRWALGCDLAANGSQDFFLWDEQATAVRFVVNSQGKVGIGTAPPDNASLYRLYVGDGIATRDVKVTANLNWPDYVFHQGYDLLPLSQWRARLLEEKHLPGIPSAAEVEANQGYELGDLQVRLLRVVEEQALYILQLEERVRALEQATIKH